jgi:hypothetical protein
MIAEYFKNAKEEIEKLEWLIDQSSIKTEYDEELNIGMISGSLLFKDGSDFHFTELFLEKGRRYRFHYMDENKNLILRWDDAPHHKNLKTFPYHIHFPDDTKESEPIQLIEALYKIADRVIEKLMSSTKENIENF